MLCAADFLTTNQNRMMHLQIIGGKKAICGWKSENLINFVRNVYNYDKLTGRVEL